MSLSIDAYVINLVHRTDRRTEFTNHWNSLKLGIDINIIDAVLDKDFGGLGCAKSHVLALSEFIGHGKSDYCMILEDDFRFNCEREEFYRCIEYFMQSNNSVFLLAGTSVIRSGKFGKGFEFIFESATTSGYVLKRSYVQNLISVFFQSISCMERYRTVEPRSLIYGRFAIDQAWKILQRQGGWCARIPMLGAQVESFSDIEGRIVDYSSIAS